MNTTISAATTDPGLNSEALSAWNVAWLPTSKLKPFERNPRKLSDRAIEVVGTSIEQNGWQQPIVTDKDYVIIVGHVRWHAAKKRGIQYVPVHIADNLTSAQVKAYRIMDNRSHEETGWDLDLLPLEIAELAALEFDLKYTGFEPRQIEELLANKDTAADDAANQEQPPPLNPVSQPGDVWNCGPHRVLHGDATNPEHVARILGDVRPLILITDPPYGVQLDPLWREEAGLGSAVQTGKIANDDRVDWSDAFRLFPGDVAYVWHAGIHSGPVAASLQGLGLEIRAQIIWTKPHFVLSRGAYHWQHEPCYFCVRKGSRSHWRGDRTQSTVWPVATLNPFGGKNAEETPTGHGSQKPIELMRRPILNHTEHGDVIYDCFLGSGTTLIAAELTGRICYGLEIDPAYVDVTVRRWQLLSGKPATLEGDGRTFDQIKTQRSQESIEIDIQPVTITLRDESSNV